MSDPERRAHDREMVAAWRENLLHLIIAAELAFSVVADGWKPEDAKEWAASLERQMLEVNRRAGALQSHMAHAFNLAELDQHRENAASATVSALHPGKDSS